MATCVEVAELKADNRFYSRIMELQEFYINEFKNKPKFFVRVPGRVNIIGEHVDYCGYPVLPMAIDQCILLAVGYEKSNSMLHLRNSNWQKFENFDCDLNSLKSIILDKGTPDWYKYFLCGVKGIFEIFGEGTLTIGMKVALSGNIPPAAGLSSSSALVSAAALACARAYELDLDCKNLASISANCERFIGTQGGGMDQAIAFLAKSGCAQFIEFFPELKATPIRLEKGMCFVVINSLAEVNKAASSDFNERVVECRLGSRLIAKEMDLSNWRNLTRFVEVQEALECSLKKLEELTLKYLKNEYFTKEEICQRLDVDEQEFENKFLTPNTQHMTTFKLRQRALHVIQESIRVLDFRSICERNGGDVEENVTPNTPSHKETFQALSRLMRESHRSLKELYECSHPDLDRIIEIADDVGVGARLTGAGWGGCVIALCDSSSVSTKFIQEMKDRYFYQMPVKKLNENMGNDFNDAIFETSPQGGAQLYNL